MKEITVGVMILSISILGFAYRFCYESSDTKGVAITSPPKPRTVCLLYIFNQPDDPLRASYLINSTTSISQNITASETVIPSPSAEA